MKTMDIDTPSDNSNIVQALEDLDAKLAAWTKAVHEVQSKCREQTGDEEKPKEVVNQQEQISQQSDQEEQITQQIDHEEKISQQSDIGAEADNLEEYVEKESISTEVNQEVCTPCVQSESNEQMDDSVSDDDSDDDKELLASLDEETAKRIRVLRRLASGKKSVRELLEMSKKTEQQPNEKQKQPRKKLWILGKRG